MKKLLKIGFVAVAMLFAAPKLYAQISIGITISAHTAPPALPVYTQPPCPVDGYLWQPGYWAWDNDAGDYYWVPGVWVAPPQPGYLWTPAYWGYENGVYGFHPGYWGPHVGFYGGINYGGGYAGVGFVGGNWSGGHFRYNTAVVNVNKTIVHNTYVDRTVIVNHTVVNNHVSFNGGSGGVQAKPRPEELTATKDHHIQATSAQQTHERSARQDKGAFSKSNGGRPTHTAVNKVETHQESKSPHNAEPKKAGNEGSDRNTSAKQTNPEHNKPAENHKTDNRVKATPAKTEYAEKPEQRTKPEQAKPEHAVKPESQEKPEKPANAASKMSQHTQQHQQPHTQQHNTPKQEPHEQRPAEKEHH